MSFITPLVPFAERWIITMAKQMLVKGMREDEYSIVLEFSFEKLLEQWNFLCRNNQKVCIVTDSNVGPLYSNEVSTVLKNHVKEISVFTFPAGEENKTLSTVESLYTYLITNKFERKDVLIALGGGVVGDLTGYTAATYLRGIDYIQIPTTLLSQVDSSIGGKTGVDFKKYKNMVGAFHMPKFVYMNLEVLESLDKRQFSSGMAEIIKHGLIRDPLFFQWILSNVKNILKRDKKTIEEMIYKSCLIKKEIVERDPTEQGERALLNFGHTIGHAIEKTKNFQMLHGECVALGSVAAAYISMERELLKKEEYENIKYIFESFSLPICTRNISPEEIVEITKSDKKMEGGVVKFILLEKIGKAIIDKSVKEEEMLKGMKEILLYE